MNVSVSDVFSAANNIIGYLKSLGINFSKSAIVLYDSNKIQYRYRISLGNSASRSGELLNRIKSKASKPIDLGETANISVIGVPANENLSSVVKREAKNSSIDIGLLFKSATSEEVIIQFEKQLTAAQLDLLIPVIRPLTNPIYRPDKWVETPIEVVVDGGKEWKGKFDEIKIRDFHRNYQLKFTFDELMGLCPEKLRKFIESARDARTIDMVTRTTINRISQVFQEFASKDVMEHASKFVSSDMPRNVQLHGVRCTVQEFIIHGTKLVMPGLITLPVDLEIDAENLTLSAKLVVDMPQFNDLVSRLALKAEQKL